MLEVGVLYSNHFLYLTLLLRNVYYLHFHKCTVMIPKVRKNCTSYDSLIVDSAFACLLITSERHLVVCEYIIVIAHSFHSDPTLNRKISKK